MYSTIYGDKKYFYHRYNISYFNYPDLQVDMDYFSSLNSKIAHIFKLNNEINKVIYSKSDYRRIAFYE